ncbi:ATP synthase F1 subunit gamma [Megasphaera butyrica]|uniref:ATP synthase F1 subunit gamma n=1 Tax=Megasphaera TaxID=906 RepID=UPI000822B670|nr:MULTISPECIES: ATP synthase F1 subunit gamma [Megasphaera]SCJ62666.1 F-ATPase gamma subunit [uncultured Ruminococcus sp.]MBM6733275.1 ATP synthase F1 subunit gamma [Megasphaera stantonii]MCU6715478.1 ATP synthase F1 subunit gamma [Megasphaera butyrica]NJE33796.1 ATP synthase F1 subunit gamma [Megasphaera sp. SW808]OUO48353.1 ATP synthase F1 subunit gamma [Megasphaera sp. An286]
MPSAREINRRIKSVTNTQQITKAMKMVSSVRLRRAQERALATAPYTEKIEGMLQRLAAASTGEKVALFTPHDEVKKTCYIIVGADKGLAGAFNSNINKAMVAVLKDKPRSASMLLVTGRKPAEYLKHLHIVPDQKWTGFSDKPQFTDAQQIAHVATEQFLAGEVDEVYIIYTKFKSALSQEVQTVKMLPISQQDGSEKTGPKEEYLFAPDAHQVLESLLPQYLDMLVYNSLLQSAASELGARMTAMTSATDNAGELIDRLTVHYNKVRQAGITNELTEIVSGANALQ